MKKTNVVGAIIINKDNKILSVQRPLDKNLGGYYEFVGGKIEENEDEFTALKRELIEELDLVVEMEDSIYDRVEYQYDFGFVILSVIKCYLLEDQPIILKEHTDMKWLSINQLDDVVWAPADVPIIEKIIEDKEIFLNKNNKS